MKIYFFFIRPALEYADVKWDDIPEYLRQKQKPENIQLEAAQIVTRGVGNRMVPSNFYIEKQAGRYYQSIGKIINLINYLRCFMAKPLNIYLIFYKHKLL